MDRLEYLKQVVAEATDSMRAIDEAAKADGEVRSLTAEEDADFDYLLGVRNACIAEGIQLEKRNAALAAVIPTATREAGDDRGAPAFHREVDPYSAEYRSQVGDYEAAKRAVGEMDARGVPAEGQERADRLRKMDPEHSPTGDRHMRGISRHLLAFGSDAYARAFPKVLFNRHHELTDDERQALHYAEAEKRAMSIGTTTAGGFMIPTILDPSVIWTTTGAVNPFRQIANVKSIMTNTWTGVTSAGISMSWDTEGSEVSDDTPTLAQPTVTAYRLTGFVPFSIEAEADISGLGSELVAEFAQARDEAEASAFATGSGSSQPYGIVTALSGTTRYTSCATNSTIVVADLEKARAHLGPRYRSNASWVMNQSINDAVRNLGTSSYSTWTAQLPELAVDRLLGRPVYESSAMTGALNTTTNNIAVYGDFGANYVIADRIGTTVEYIPHLFATGNGRPSGQRGLYTYHRVGADSVNDAGFTLLVNQNTAFV